MQAALTWFKHNSALHSHSFTTWPWWDGERIRSEGAHGFFMKTGFKRWRKSMLTSKAKQGMLPALPVSRQVLNNPQENRRSITHSGDLGGQMLSLQTPHTHFLLLSVFYADNDAYNNIPVIIWGQLSCLCPLPIPCAPAHCWNEVRRRKLLDSVQALLSNNDRISVLSTLFQQKSKTQPHGRSCEGN